MRSKKSKKNKKKGFTLIELLAVIVILAVVMGIAVNSVLTSMNKARGGAAVDTAKVIAKGFSQKFTEEQVGGSPIEVYKGTNGFAGYDFSKTSAYVIDTKLADAFNISTDTYTLGDSTASSEKIDLTATNANVTKSFVIFDADTANFTVCMVIPKTSTNYVDAYSLKYTGTSTSSTKYIKLSNFGGTTATGAKKGTADFKNIRFKLTSSTKIMVACSDGTQTWK